MTMINGIKSNYLPKRRHAARMLKFFSVEVKKRPVFLVSRRYGSLGSR